MATHPARGRKTGAMQMRQLDGSWGPFDPAKFELGRDGFGKNDATRQSAAGIVAATVTGYAIEDAGGRARTVMEFSGDQYDHWLAGNRVDDVILRAFINPRDGSIRRDALEDAARTLLASK